MSLETEKKDTKKTTRRRPQKTTFPHRHVLPMDEVQVDLGTDLERRIDTRTNALLMGLDGGVGPGIDSGSDLNSIQPGDVDETEYESITDNNLLTQTSLINAIFQNHSVLHEDEVTAHQHMQQNRIVSNRLETDLIEEIPSQRREGEPAPLPSATRKPKRGDGSI